MLNKETELWRKWVTDKLLTEQRSLMWEWPLSPVREEIHFILKMIMEFYFYNEHFAGVPEYQIASCAVQVSLPYSRISGEHSGGSLELSAARGAIHGTLKFSPLCSTW